MYVYTWKYSFVLNARPNNVRKIQLVDFSDQWFVAVFLTLPLLGGLHFDFRQIFSPAPPLDSSAARFRSRPARCAGLSRKELRYTSCRLPLRQLHVVICVLGAIKVFGLQCAKYGAKVLASCAVLGLFKSTKPDWREWAGRVLRKLAGVYFESWNTFSCQSRFVELLIWNAFTFPRNKSRPYVRSTTQISNFSYTFAGGVSPI